VYINIRATHHSAAIEVEKANILFSQQKNSDEAPIGLLNEDLAIKQSAS
jgi:hypothetical protein